MKRTSVCTLGFLFALLSTLTFISSCDVEHTYEAEIHVVNALGDEVSGVTVTASVPADRPTDVYRAGITDSDGLISFSWNNLAILKINADKGNYHGEGLLILEEDEKVQLNVVVYD